MKQPNCQTRAGICAAFLLCTLLGCRHQEPPVVVTQKVEAPPEAPAPITVITPLPSLPPTPKPDVQLAPLELPPPKLAKVEHPHRLHRKARHPATAAADTGAVKPPSTTPAETPSAAPATGTPVNGGTATAGNVTSSTLAKEAAPELGNLSTGTEISSNDKIRMNREIEQLESRLSKLKEPATSDEKTALLQVRAFLARAKQSIAENDLDGAQTLNTKARVLLEELQSE